jgi:hypothetical protein
MKVDRQRTRYCRSSKFFDGRLLSERKGHTCVWGFAAGIGACEFDLNAVTAGVCGVVGLLELLHVHRTPLLHAMTRLSYAFLAVLSLTILVQLEAARLDP